MIKSDTLEADILRTSDYDYIEVHKSNIFVYPESGDETADLQDVPSITICNKYGPKFKLSKDDLLYLLNNYFPNDRS